MVICHSAAEKRLAFMDAYPTFYEDKQSVKTHIDAARFCMSSAWEAIIQMERIKKSE